MSKEDIENVDLSLGQLIATSNRTVEALEEQLKHNSSFYRKDKNKLLDEIERREQLYLEKLSVRDNEIAKMKQTFHKIKRIEDTKNTTLLKQNKILEKALKGIMH